MPCLVVSAALHLPALVWMAYALARPAPRKPISVAIYERPRGSGGALSGVDELAAKSAGNGVRRCLSPLGEGRDEAASASGPAGVLPTSSLSAVGDLPVPVGQVSPGAVSPADAAHPGPLPEGEDGGTSVGRNGTGLGGSGIGSGGGGGTGDGSGQGPGGSGAGGSSAQLDEIQRRLARAAADCYPPLANRFHLQGRAVVRFCLDSQGSLQERKLITSSGQALLDEAASGCVLDHALPLPGGPQCLTLPVDFVVPGRRHAQVPPEGSHR